jgi:hypothetical protein
MPDILYDAVYVSFSPGAMALFWALRESEMINNSRTDIRI